MCLGAETCGVYEAADRHRGSLDVSCDCWLARNSAAVSASQGASPKPLKYNDLDRKERKEPEVEAAGAKRSWWKDLFLKLVVSSEVCRQLNGEVACL
jgi:hypothetical protein